MTTVRHLNCGWLHAPPHPRASCHYLPLDTPGGPILVDAGIGLLGVRDPHGRLGRGLIDVAGFRFREEGTAARRLERLGVRPADRRTVVRAGGPAGRSGDRCRGPVDPAVRAHARPLRGRGPHGGRWVMHVGDASYLRVELVTDDHPVSALAALRADDDARRRARLAELRRLVARDHAAEVNLFGYHDVSEFPPGTRSRDTRRRHGPHGPPGPWATGLREPRTDAPCGRTPAPARPPSATSRRVALARARPGWG